MDERNETHSRSPRPETHCCVAWLSLDERDSDTGLFRTYLIAALQTVAPEIGVLVLALLESPPVPIPFSAPPSQRERGETDSGKSSSGNDSERRGIQSALAALISDSVADPPLHLSRLRGLRQLTDRIALA
jgi:hypothetical protein